MKKNAIIEKTLTISTGHIKKSTAEKLDEAKEDDLPFRMAKHEYGYILFVNSMEWVDEPIVKEVPKELVKIMKYADKHGCTLVNLDADAYESDKLKTYIWK